MDLAYLRFPPRTGLAFVLYRSTHGLKLDTVFLRPAPCAASNRMAGVAGGSYTRHFFMISMTYTKTVSMTSSRQLTPSLHGA